MGILTLFGRFVGVVVVSVCAVVGAMDIGKTVFGWYKSAKASTPTSPA